MKEKSRPAAVRENLKNARDAAINLSEAINKLDQNSTHLLKETRGMDKDKLHGALAPIVDALFCAGRLADRLYSKRGKLPQDEQRFLAAEVRDILKSRKSLSSNRVLKDGLFEAILKVILEETFRKSRKDIESIAASLVDVVLKHEIRTVNEGGLIEYHLPR